MEIKDVSKNLTKQVSYKSGSNISEYKFTACILRVRDGQYYYQAELTDKNNKSVVIVSLDKVEELGSPLRELV